MVYHYSGWIIIWSILYYFRLVQYPPLRFVILSALAFSTLLLLKYKVPLCYITLSALLHSIPLFLVDNKKDNMTIYINIIAFCSYVILMNLFNINILDNYKKTAIQLEKNPSIEYVIKNILFQK